MHFPHPVKPFDQRGEKNRGCDKRALVYGPERRRSFASL